MTQAKEQEFNKLTDQFIQYWLKSNPVQATIAGIYDYNEELADFSPRGMERHHARLVDFQSKFKAFNKRMLPVDDQVDLSLILDHLDLQLLSEEKLKPQLNMPELYLEEILSGVHVLLSRDILTLKERGIAALRRINAGFTLLRQARKNTVKAPVAYAEGAIQVALGAETYFRHEIHAFADQLRGSLREALQEDAVQMADELAEFATFLQEEVIPNTAKSEFALGKPTYNQFLRLKHRVNTKHHELLKMANQSVAEAEQELEACAKELGEKKRWQNLVEKLEMDAPNSRNFLKTYANELKRVRKFTEQVLHLELPPEEDLDVMETPAFARPFTPYTVYQGPGFRCPDTRSFLWTTAAEGAKPGEKRLWLRGHSRWQIPMICTYEAYPGNYLRDFYNRRNQNPIRHLFSSNMLRNGWGFFCEGLALDEGYYADAKVRLFACRGKLLRALRVVIDVGLQTKTMKPAAAAKLLMDRAGLGEYQAKAEVQSFCRKPAEGVSAYLGRRELERLQAKMEKQQGEAFNRAEFFTKVLECGPIPVELIDEQLFPKE